MVRMRTSPRRRTGLQDTCKDAVFPELQGNVVGTMLQYQTSVANDSTWNDPYNTTFTRPAPPLPPPPEQEPEAIDASGAHLLIGTCFRRSCVLDSKFHMFHAILFAPVEGHRKFLFVSSYSCVDLIAHVYLIRLS